MKIEYPALIRYSASDDAYLVEFPDLPGCVTFGKTQTEAEQMAQEVLSSYLESVMDRDLVFRLPSALIDAVFVAPSPGVAFALWLRTKRKERGLTQTEVAELLGVRYQVYQKLENPVTANPTLKTLAKLEKVFKEPLITV